MEEDKIRLDLSERFDEENQKRTTPPAVLKLPSRMEQGLHNFTQLRSVSW